MFKLCTSSFLNDGFMSLLLCMNWIVISLKCLCFWSCMDCIWYWEIPGIEWCALSSSRRRRRRVYALKGCSTLKRKVERCVVKDVEAIEGKKLNSQEWSRRRRRMYGALNTCSQASTSISVSCVYLYSKEMCCLLQADHEITGITASIAHEWSDLGSYVTWLLHIKWSVPYIHHGTKFTEMSNCRWRSHEMFNHTADILIIINVNHGFIRFKPSMRDCTPIAANM